MGEATGTQLWTGPRRFFSALALLGAGLALAGCQTDGTASVASPGGRTLAFDSIDGPPKNTFEQLVGQLTTQAQVQQVSVVSRAEPAAYRVRGYLAVHVEKTKTSVAYAWDVFDANKQRVARVTGEEVAKRVKGDAWAVCDEDMLNRIADKSMASLAETLGVAAPASAARAPAPATAAAPAAEPPAPAAAPPVIDGDGPPIASNEIAAPGPLAFAQQ
ncbi:MAG: hypothetical protein B7Z15_05620 [Rhizobiales bacterium 32-66-8]|jgi:hypothetical protein|nr:MAG: hypothetical protein B7Z15_05620 [Rhizobiales bacterium 32-66-8]